MSLAEREITGVSSPVSGPIAAMTTLVSRQVQHSLRSRANDFVTASVAVTSCTCCRHRRPRRSWMQLSQ